MTRSGGGIRRLEKTAAMLETFITANRESIIFHARARAAGRGSPTTDPESKTGIPIFLDQLTAALRLARSPSEIDHAAIRATAGQHGRDLLGRGLTIAQVVHDYGDVCQTVTELAARQETSISVAEFQIMNLCLDNAIAEAVTGYAHGRERSIEDEGTERLGVLAHELRNLLNTAVLSFESIRAGRVGVTGGTALVHARSLAGLCQLIDRSLAEVRMEAGVGRHEALSVADFVEEIAASARAQAQARAIQLSIAPVDATLVITGDRQILVAAVTNLLQNAFKFTPEHGHVSLDTREVDGRVLFEIHDECSGLPNGAVEDLFVPYSQRGADRTGVGLGLSICLKAAHANAGEIHVRDLPGRGCVFTLDLPLTSSTAPL